MDEATRAAYYQAEEALYALPTPEGFDFDALERLYIKDAPAGARMLAEAAKITEQDATLLLQRVYGM